MTRLPTPGADTNSWGNILNDFLSVEHNADGSLKVTSTLMAAIGTKTDASGGGRDRLSTLASAGVAPIINLNDGNVHHITLTASITAITLSGATAGVACAISLYVQQDGAGARVVSWPASVKWPGGIAPTLTASAGAIDLIVLETIDGGTTWFGALAGADYR